MAIMAAIALVRSAWLLAHSLAVGRSLVGITAKAAIRGRPQDQVLDTIPASQPIAAGFVTADDEDLIRGNLDAECPCLSLDRRTKKPVDTAVRTRLCRVGYRLPGGNRRRCDPLGQHEDAADLLAAALRVSPRLKTSQNTPPLTATQCVLRKTTQG